MSASLVGCCPTVSLFSIKKKKKRNKTSGSGEEKHSKRFCVCCTLPNLALLFFFLFLHECVVWECAFQLLCDQFSIFFSQACRFFGPLLYLYEA